MSSYLWLAPWVLAIVVVPAFVAAIAVEPALVGRPRRTLRRAIAGVALLALALALAVANFADGTVDAWPTSRVHSAVTLSALALCAVASVLLTRWPGPRGAGTTLARNG
jgi:hypothetical protein